MNKRSAVSGLLLMMMALFATAGCIDPTIGMVDPVPGKVVEESRPANDFNSINERLDAIEQRVMELKEVAELSGELSLKNQSIIVELSARLDAAKSPISGGELGGAEKKALYTQQLSREELYLSAYREYLAGNYSEAILRFEAYGAEYPGSRLADNAVYWLGEAYYMIEDVPKAIDSLNRVTNEFPNANRVPYALYRVGLIYDEVGDDTSAGERFRTLLVRFPNSDPARLAMARIKKIEQRGGETE